MKKRDSELEPGDVLIDATGRPWIVLTGNFQCDRKPYMCTDGRKKLYMDSSGGMIPGEIYDDTEWNVIQ